MLLDKWMNERILVYYMMQIIARIYWMPSFTSQIPNTCLKNVYGL